ncbi:hypothetical protein E2542_SST24062 [Spatholobus suberectus]|nr:hypothetical protein E2542_SST24062 [Spatholobus suberectus]
MKEVSPQQTLGKKFIKKTISNNHKNTSVAQVLVLATAMVPLINNNKSNQEEKKPTWNPRQIFNPKLQFLPCTYNLINPKIVGF